MLKTPIYLPSIIFAVLSATCIAGPICPAPSTTLSQKLQDADSVYLVEWQSTEKSGKEDKNGSTEFLIVAIERDASDSLKVGQAVTWAEHKPGKKGDLFIRYGRLKKQKKTERLIEASKAGFRYAVESPDPDAEPVDRLIYYLRFLEHADKFIADDAYEEFKRVRRSDIVDLSKHTELPRDNIRKWIVSDKTPKHRRGIYGVMLGLCGNAEDAAILKQRLLETAESYRVGIDGVIAGYLLLTGSKGLELVEHAKLKGPYTVDPDEDSSEESKRKHEQVAFAETYSAIMALRFMWTFGEGRIEKDRLRQAMRLVLDQPKLADLVIPDLYRWKDWSVMDRLMKMYTDADFGIPWTRRVIIRYMMVAAIEYDEDQADKLPEHVIKAKANLKKLEEIDPKNYRDAKRFFSVFKKSSN